MVSKLAKTLSTFSLTISDKIMMADSVTKRQVELEESLNKKTKSFCPNTSLDLSIISPWDKLTNQDDSGYTGLDSTPRRPYRRVQAQRRHLKPKLNDATFNMSHHSLVQVIHLIVVILVAASLCFGVMVGTMDRDRTNMK